MGIDHFSRNSPYLEKKKQQVALLSVASNTVLVIFKLIVGLIIGSVSVISEAIHSGLDLVAALIAYYAVRKSSKPPDKKHKFGYGKFEDISGMVEALLIFLAAGIISVEAVKKLFVPYPMENLNLGMGVMLISAIVNLVVSQRLMEVAKETDSIALEADAWHLRTDVYTSLGVFIGLLAIELTGMMFIDPLIALLVALIITRAAYNLTRKSLGDLTDVKLPDEEEQLIIQIIKEKYPEIICYHKLRSRKSGALRFVDFHIVVDKEMTVEKAHLICDHLEKGISAALPNVHVLIHVEPYSEEPK